MKTLPRLLLLLAVLCSGTGSAWAFIEDKEARLAILELRKQVESLRQLSERLGRESQAGSDDNTQLRRALLDMQSQIDALRAELSQAKGDRELLARELAETQRKVKNQAQGVEERLRKFEPIRVKIDGADVDVEPAEAKDYDQALAVFRKGDFAAASLMYIDFLRRYPQTPYMTPALFWLGNAQYATRDYKSAISSFWQLIQFAPDHPRAPESWLAIANCQIEMKDTKAARKTLEDLIKAHPTSEAASAAKERLAKLK
ncbi:MAG: tol-pal system protein YbgF [Alphaproteobacteria bacterium]|nr:tol-pal system protein YbgF [Alphaproteobacteria bacterium]